MLSLEDLYVASQAQRLQLVDGERLRGLLSELARQPERVQLVRVLHDRFALPLHQSKGLYDQAQRYLRQRSEERYALLLKRGVPAEQVDQLSREQAAANYSWTLGERLVTAGRITPQQHAQLLAEAQRQLGDEERTLVQKNLALAFAPVLGPPPGARPPLTTSGEIPVVGGALGAELSGDDAERTMQLPAGSFSGDLGAPPPPPLPGAPGGEDGVRTMELDRPASGSFHGGSFVQPLDGTPQGAAAEEDELSFDASALTVQLGPGSVADAMGAGSGLGAPPQGAAAQANPFGTLQFDPSSGQAAGGGPAPVASGGLGAGQVLGGRFAVERELGRGAMGVVYLARDPARGPVAVKVVQGPATEEVRGRFQREIAVSKRATHRHVIEVFDAGELPDGSSFMVMEVLEGQSLQGLILREGPQPVERALALLEQILEGLAAVHEAGIVHRDLKPENLQVLEREGADHIKLVDFGISRFLNDDSPEAENMFVTVRGQLSGTPQYVAPEAVLEPDTVAASHDVYACGVIAYELLTGVLPFPPARNLRDMLSNTVNARAIPMDEAHPAGAPYAPALERFVRRLLEKDPEARPGTAAAALELLRETRDELGGRTRRSGGGGSSESEGFTRRLLRSITGIFKREK